MARVISGPFVGFSGTVDGFTYYQINGVTFVKKQNSKSKTPRSAGQKKNSGIMGMASTFMNPFNDVAKVTYKHIAKAIGQNAHDAMKSHILLDTIDRAAEKSKIDFKKLLISQGKLATAPTNQVEMTAEGLAFTWNPDYEEGKAHYTDQVIMLAYFPELEEVVVKIGGAERGAGKDTLLLNGVENGYAAEVYISFIANDHSDLANSIYMGTLNW